MNKQVPKINDEVSFNFDSRIYFIKQIDGDRIILSNNVGYPLYWFNKTGKRSWMIKRKYR